MLLLSIHSVSCMNTNTLFGALLLERKVCFCEVKLFWLKHKEQVCTAADVINGCLWMRM